MTIHNKILKLIEQSKNSYELAENIEELVEEERNRMTENLEKFQEIVNTYYVSSDAIDDDNEMLKSLIKECFRLLDALKDK